MTKEIIERLRSLDLSGGSHSRLSAIASCFLEPSFGWTRGACEELRDKLIEILEGKDGNDDNDHAHAHGCDYGHHRCDQHQVSYDVLGNERHKAVCGLRGISIDALCKKYDYVDIYPEFIWAVGRAIGLRHDAAFNGASFEEIINRLIHLLGGDQPTLSDLYGILQDGEESENKDSESAHKITKSAEIAKPESEDGGKVTITDELREWIKSLYTPNSDKLKLEGLRIADRIDEQFDRICEQQETVLQQTINEMVEQRDGARMEVINLRDTYYQMQRRYEQECADLAKGIDDARESEYRAERQRDELQAKLDEYDQTHVELPKDENDEYIHIGDVMDGYAKTIEVVELRYGRSGWVLISRDGNGYADTFAFAHHHEPTVEQVIRDLTLGKITESQAIERIEGINGQG